MANISRQLFCINMQRFIANIAIKWYIYYFYLLSFCLKCTYHAKYLLCDISAIISININKSYKSLIAKINCESIIVNDNNHRELSHIEETTIS